MECTGMFPGMTLMGRRGTMCGLNLRYQTVSLTSLWKTEMLGIQSLFIDGPYIRSFGV